MIPINPAEPLTDFRKFLYLVWKYLASVGSLPAGTVPTPIQYDMAYWMQTGPRRRGVEGFRGVAKSWIAGAFTTFCLYHNPALNILVVSASGKKAEEFSTFVLGLIKGMPLLQHLAPREGQRDSKIGFDVGPAPISQSPSVKSIGLTGQITGGRADLIIPDDIEVPNNSATVMMREKLSEAVKEFDAVLKPGGHIVALGTPQCEDSIYPKLEERDYHFRIWPIRYPDEARRAKYGHRLSPALLADLERQPDLVGRSTEPTRFPEPEIIQREISYGRAGFALQFMLDTDLSDAERYPLRLSDLCFMPLDPERGPEKVIWTNDPEKLLNDPIQYPNVGLSRDRIHRPTLLPDIKYLPYSGCVMYVDPSGRGRDETGYAVVAHLNGQLFLLDAGGFNDGYSPTTLESICRIAKRWRVNVILAEPNYGDGMFTQLLKPVARLICPETGVDDAERSVGQKEKRIADTLEPVFNQHRLVVNSSLLKKDYDSTSGLPLEGGAQQRYRLFFQMTRLTRDKGALVNDDRIEALSGAVGHWVGAMAQDVEKAVSDAREGLLREELDRFMESVTGYQRPEPSVVPSWN